MLLQARVVHISHRYGSSHGLSARARYTVSGIALGAILALTSFLDLFSRIKLGPVSANGFLTVLYGAVAVLLLAMRRNVPRQVQAAVRPGAVFVAWAIASILWNTGRSVETIQNICVLVLFVAAIVVIGSQSANSGTVPVLLMKQLPWALYLSTTIFVSTIFHLYGVQPRLYALYASVGVMWFAAGWRFHERRAKAITLAIVFCIGWSLSRTSLISCILVLPWVVALRVKSLKGWLRPIATLLTLGAVTIAAILSVPSLQKRFTEEGDQGVTVSGTAISTQGRAQIWVAVFKDAMLSPIMGHGAGSATDLVTKQFGASIAQPHNDYLRIFHDYGLVGITLWVVFVIYLFSSMRRQYRVAKSSGNINRQRNVVAAVSGMVMVLLSMTTDNIIIYPGPMFLEAILLGAALGTGANDKPR